jgi:hypothetical protein
MDQSLVFTPYLPRDYKRFQPAQKVKSAIQLISPFNHYLIQLQEIVAA